MYVLLILYILKQQAVDELHEANDRKPISVLKPFVSAARWGSLPCFISQ